MSSPAKLFPMIFARNRDGRFRGSFLYYGAATGRWAGKVLQPQIFPRGVLGSDERVEACIGAFNKGDLDLIRREYGDVMTAAASCLRGMIVPEQGKDFIGADFSSIEGRVLAWLAGEETALAVYREGRDPYKVNAAQIYGVAYDEVTKSRDRSARSPSLRSAIRVVSVRSPGWAKHTALSFPRRRSRASSGSGVWLTR